MCFVGCEYKVLCFVGIGFVGCDMLRIVMIGFAGLGGAMSYASGTGRLAAIRKSIYPSENISLK